MPSPDGDIVRVSSVSELVQAVNNAHPGTTILVADGTYDLDGAYLRFDVPDVTLRSESGDREAVILDGKYITTEIIQIVASNVTIADLTLKQAYYHPIHIMSTNESDTNNVLIYNVHIIDPGEQAIKINPAGAGHYTDYGTIACCHLELTDQGRTHIRNNCYTGGVDAHQSKGWVIRDNLIEGFWCQGGLSEHGIHFWVTSRDTVVKRNILRNNARGIGFGLLENGTGRMYEDNPCPGAQGGYVDHYGGLVANNFVFANDKGLFASEYGFDSGISMWQACGAKVLNNTVASTHPPFSSIEWRFSNTAVEIKYNIATHNLMDRGGSAELETNLQFAPLSMFVDAEAGDLHLGSWASDAIDKAGLGEEVHDDIDGDPRPFGSLPDIGADEYRLSVSQIDFGKSDCEDEDPCMGDLDQDGDVDGLDLINLALYLSM